MKFCEAMEKLKAGSRVTREPWKGGVYFVMVAEDVKSFQPKLSPYIYNEDIMVSDGWMVEGDENEYKFCDIIPFLQQGKHARLKDWNNMYIYLDRQNKMLVVHSMEVLPFVPDFDSFVAQDWIEL
ncbi:DUF2829 domain-containing protein [Mangrovimonas sp. AS39]|uniref:DUF2829 domain-containing protein n=1 Tax=Mangrovimonas futianensis TaxID=2895523 RepID=UPI001E5C3CE0|nr:DUF2829 domain-containing protein [Mangrovimonas futianensis]MCF1193181.1 DUF2829 domain-containing protein [Mangrovimonas futianensis]